MTTAEEGFPRLLEEAPSDPAVLVDKTGRVRCLVADEGRTPEEQRRTYVRGALDAYINGVYRSLKRLGNGNRLGSRLEAADSIGYELTVISRSRGGTGRTMATSNGTAGLSAPGLPARPRRAAGNGRCHPGGCRPGAPRGARGRGPRLS